jgi:hypothetical protein
VKITCVSIQFMCVAALFNLNLFLFIFVSEFLFLLDFSMFRWDGVSAFDVAFIRNLMSFYNI